VENGTLSPSIAALFEAIGRERRSFVVFAVPRLAGKTTLMSLILECAPGGTPLHVLNSEAAFRRAEEETPPAYLVIPEVAPYAVMPGYLWGEPVRRAFALLQRGLSLATALHAPDVLAAYEVLAEGNGVPDGDLARLEFAIEVRSIGPWQAPQRRVVAAVHQVLGVTSGVPELRLLERWDEAADWFEASEAPIGLGGPGALAAAARRFEAR
jgi:hypothetical protein